ncbi:MAG: acetyltransferase [Nostocaceae cyanobacterium]|nr:acetyltransferase [Nostocaceae cyanobacterium]
MLMQDKTTGVLVKILDVEELINPNKNDISGQSQSGQEEQQPESFNKENLIFPSGEQLPRCWIDVDYKKAE